MSKATIDFINEKILRYKDYIRDRELKLIDSEKHISDLKAEINDFNAEVASLEQDLERLK